MKSGILKHGFAACAFDWAVWSLSLSAYDDGGVTRVYICACTIKRFKLDSFEQGENIEAYHVSGIGGGIVTVNSLNGCRRRTEAMLAWTV